MFIDSHCHLYRPFFENGFNSIFEEMERNKVVGALCSSVSLSSYDSMLELMDSHNNIWGSVGVHPNTRSSGLTVKNLTDLFSDNRFIAVGETGLDYYRNDTNSDLDWQREQFKIHIRAARETGKPLIIHSRDAEDDTIKILIDEKAHQVSGVIHCFTGTKNFAKLAVEELGFAISFSGIITFRKSVALREIAAETPLEHLLIETDAPYLAPEPHRGKENQPGWVYYVAQELARVKGVSVEEIGEITTKNFYNLFKPFSKKED